MSEFKKRKVLSSGKSIVEEPHIVNADGEHLYCRYWEPQSSPTFLVCILHGYGAHCERHSELAGHLTDIGAYVFAHDHIGHGESEGEGWFITDFNVLIRDTLQHVTMMKEKNPELPVFIYGHSLGANIAILAAHEKPELFQGVILCGGSVIPMPNQVSPFKLFLLRNIVKIFPRFQLPKLTAEYLSRDKKEVKICEDDPLQVKHGILAQSAHSLLQMTDRIREIMDSVEFPLLVVHGGDDKIANVEASKFVHENAKSADKTIKIYDGLYHNLEHELKEDRNRYFNDVIEWVRQRVESSRN